MEYVSIRVGRAYSRMIISKPVLAFINVVESVYK